MKQELISVLRAKRRKKSKLKNILEAFNYLHIDQIDVKELKSKIERTNNEIDWYKKHYKKIVNRNFYDDVGDSLQKRIKKKKQSSKYKKKYYTYLESDEWATIRIEMLTKYPYCQRCGYKHTLQVHHKTYKNVFNENPEDLEVICKKCHQEEHNLIYSK